jgi:SAM-dependent methyltransferase
MSSVSDLVTEFSYAGSELELVAHATNWKSYVRSRLARHISGRVLEVGAGVGGTTVHLRHDRVAEWVCVEPDAALVEELRSNLRSTRSPVPTRVVRGTVESIPSDERFDCILYIDVLEHIDDDVGELKAAASLLAPEGRLVVLCPAFPFLFSELDRAIGHYRRYTKQSMSAVCPQSLQVVERFYLDSLGVLASLANRLFLRQPTLKASQVRFWDALIIPLSRLFDPLIRYSLGRSVVAVFRNPVDASLAAGGPP